MYGRKPISKACTFSRKITRSILPVAAALTWEGLRLRTGGVGFASREFLSVTLAMERTQAAPTPANDAAFAEKYGAAHQSLETRLREESRVSDVTYSLQDPGNELHMALEAEGQPNPGDPVGYNIVEGRTSGRVWLLSIARRVCADAIRSAQRRRALEARWRLERRTNDVSDTVSLELLLDALDPDRREAFVLTQIVGLPYAAAAEVCRVPIGTIRSRVARAREELQASLRQEDAG